MSAPRLDAMLWTLSAVAVAGLVVLSIGPDPRVGPLRGFGSSLHGVAFATLSFLLLLVAVWRPGRGQGRFPRAALAIVAVLLLVGVGLELLQRVEIFAGRQPEVGDAVAGGLGVVAGAGAWWLLRRGKPA